MSSLLDPTCPVVKNLLVVDSEGKRIAVKYYSNDWCVQSVAEPGIKGEDRR